MTFGARDPFRPRPARRPPARMVAPAAVAGWAVLEIWLLTVVGRAAGSGAVVLLLLAGLVFGAMAVKRSGRRAFQRLTAPLRPGQSAPEERGDGGGDALAMLGGLLLMVPGLVSDAVGLLCLFPPTRALIGRAAGRALGRRTSRPGSWGDTFRQARMHRPDGKVVPGEVVREDPVPGQRGRDQDQPRPPLAR